MSEQKLRRWSDAAETNKVQDLIKVLQSLDPEARIIEIALDDSRMTWGNLHPVPYFVAELIETKKEND